MASKKNHDQDALQLLKADHDTVRKLLARLAKSTDRATSTRSDLLEKIGAELRTHARIEEDVFYPALQAAAKTKEQRKLLTEAYEEHRAVEELVLPDLEKTDVGSVEFGGRAKVLKEMVEHHADEEEKEMFPMARKLLGKEELRELGQRLQEAKDGLTAARR